MESGRFSAPAFLFSFLTGIFVMNDLTSLDGSYSVTLSLPASYGVLVAQQREKNAKFIEDLRRGLDQTVGAFLHNFVSAGFYFIYLFV